MDQTCCPIPISDPIEFTHLCYLFILDDIALRTQQETIYSLKNEIEISTGLLQEKNRVRAWNEVSSIRFADVCAV